MIAALVTAVLGLAAAPTLAVAAVDAPARPGAALGQAAYDDARGANADRHAIDLVIETAACQPMKAGGFACQIDFTRRAEPDKRLYFDVVTMDERGGRWVLLGGLCVKKAPPPAR